MNSDKESDEKTLYVFYTVNENTDKKKYWMYGKFPKGWWWVGGGSTSMIGAPKLEYKREDQFSGPKESLSKMVDYLDAYFKKLKNDNIITKYKIRRSYLP